MREGGGEVCVWTAVPGVRAHRGPRARGACDTPRASPAPSGTRSGWAPWWLSPPSPSRRTASPALGLSGGARDNPPTLGTRGTPRAQGHPLRGWGNVGHPGTKTRWEVGDTSREHGAPLGTGAPGGDAGDVGTPRGTWGQPHRGSPVGALPAARPVLVLHGAEAIVLGAGPGAPCPVGGGGGDTDTG